MFYCLKQKLITRHLLLSGWFFTSTAKISAMP